MELHAHLLHVRHADLGQIAVQHRQHVIHGLHHGDLRAEGCIGAGQLQADHAAADDHHGRRQLLQGQSAGGVDAVGVLLQTGDGRLGIDGAGSHDDGIGGHALLAAVGLGDLQLLFAGELGGAVHLLDLVQLQQTGYAAGQLLADGVLVGDDLGEVDLHALDLYADVLALGLDLLHQLGGVQQALGGDAAHVQAGAAQILLFDNGHVSAQLCGADGGHITAGAAADDDDGLLAACGGSSGSGRSLRHSRRHSGGHRTGDSLAGLSDPRQRALHGYVVALLCHDLQQNAVLLAGQLVGQLVRGDLRHHVAGLYGIALVLDPLGEGALLHGQTQLGHFQFKSHLCILPAHRMMLMGFSSRSRSAITNLAATAPSIRRWS